MAQVPTCAAINISNAFLFWHTAWHIKASLKLKAAISIILSFEACLVKLVKASSLSIMSVVPSDGTNIAARKS